MKNFLDKIRGKVDAPPFIFDNTFFLAYSGSRAYGIESAGSDIDMVGICIPPQEYLFPESYGYIRGFGDQAPVFNDYHNPNIELDGEKYDLRIYGIVHFMELARKGNPQAIEMLFTRTADQLFCNKIGQILLQNRDRFLSKALFAPFTGYAYSQKSQIEKQAKGKRAELIEKFGYDTKAAAHAMRLMNEICYILRKGTLNIRFGCEIHSDIRKGRATIEDFYNGFDETYAMAKKRLKQSTLPENADQTVIRQILLDCINMHYQNGKAVKEFDKHRMFTNKLKELISDYNL